MKVSLQHFGDLCYPFIIINHILKISRKTPFELGKFPFNSILKILEENNVEKLTDKKYLKILEEEKVEKYKDITDFKNVYNNYGHNVSVDNTHYRIVLNHDYIVENQVVMNYDFVKNSTKAKFNNFYEDIKSDYVVFINFTDCVNDLKLKEMEDVLENKYKIKNFKILIFTNSKEIINVKNLTKTEIINVKNDYHNDWDKSIPERMVIYNEIYQKFTEIMKGIYEYPSFESSDYYKQNIHHSHLL